MRAAGGRSIASGALDGGTTRLMKSRSFAESWTWLSSKPDLNASEKCFRCCSGTLSLRRSRWRTGACDRQAPGVPPRPPWGVAQSCPARPESGPIVPLCRLVLPVPVASVWICRNWPNGSANGPGSGSDQLSAHPKMGAGSESSRCLSPFWDGHLEAGTNPPLATSQ